ncbi:MAG TPA: hypothetical protein PK992_09285 [Planctomycetaceae bacterium]|nr:hypothetical protein [Planctomycetaceae bacterium]HRA88252.1 hypothetical protein [Planctomycetaceae bacterium]
MIRYILFFSIQPVEFLKQALPFLWDWFHSRSMPKFLAGMPAVIASGLILLAVLSVRSDAGREALSTRYFRHGMSFLNEGRPDKAELFFDRAALASVNPQTLRFEAAKEFLGRDEHRRSLAIFETLAPIRSRGYKPAHEFLASYYASQLPQTDLLRVMSLYHRIYSVSDDETPRQDLAELLSRLGHYKQAADVLKRRPSMTPRSRLALTQFYFRAGRFDEGIDEARRAEQLLLLLCREDPSDAEYVILLSRSMAIQKRFLDAMFLLAEQCRAKPNGVLVDELLKCYSLWLMQMSPTVQQQQLRQLATVLDCDAFDENQIISRSELTLSSGAVLSLPSPVVVLHQYLMNGEGGWLVPFLRGTEMASQGCFRQAINELRTADQMRPQDAVIWNNLAFALLRETETKTEDMVAGLSHAPDVAILTEAMDLADAAVAASPGVQEFLETRDQIASALSRCQ